MLSTIKYLSLGLFIGIAGTSLIVAAVVFSGNDAATLQPTTEATSAFTSIPAYTPTIPSPRPTLVPTSTAMPSFTPVPSFTAVTSDIPFVEPPLTATPDAVQAALNSGELTFSGPLSLAQQIALYRASLKYVETTVEGSLLLAKQINGVGYGDPSNICGPLAIAILRDAGLMNADIIPHDFWLLNPLAAGDQLVLNRAFPRDRYLYTKSITPLNRMVWNEFPLEAGDFLFIWHGSGGNFDHMLVVNRVDSRQRAYAVTNYGTAAGFVIAETLLYDPNDPTAGIFRTWTRERNAILGSTGFGGFELWRLRSP